MAPSQEAPRCGLRETMLDAASATLLPCFLGLCTCVEAERWNTTMRPPVSLHRMCPAACASREVLSLGTNLGGFNGQSGCQGREHERIEIKSD